MCLSVAISILLITLALRVRAGHAAWFPLVLLLFSANIAAKMALSAARWEVACQNNEGVTLLAGWMFPVLCTILTPGGLRGWLWMRSREVPRSF